MKTIFHYYKIEKKSLKVKKFEPIFFVQISCKIYKMIIMFIFWYENVDLIDLIYIFLVIQKNETTGWLRHLLSQNNYDL